MRVNVRGRCPGNRLALCRQWQRFDSTSRQPEVEESPKQLMFLLPSHGRCFRPVQKCQNMLDVDPMQRDITHSPGEVNEPALLHYVSVTVRALPFNVDADSVQEPQRIPAKLKEATS